jgi:hypothetical protein
VNTQGSDLATLNYLPDYLQFISSPAAMLRPMKYLKKACLFNVWFEEPVRMLPY